MKTISIRLADTTGQTYRWTIRYAGACLLVGVPGRTRVTGWEFTTDDGCIRFQEGNWSDLVARVRVTAENYGLSIESAFD